MRYERGRTLRQSPDAPGPDVRAVRAAGLCSAPSCASAPHKILHLDIKPANIYLRTDQAELLDFGAASRHSR
jgi:serine/threonine protein kinase